MPSRSPRKILMTADAVGGVWTYAMELIRALASDGSHEFVLATLGARPSPAQIAEAATLPNTRLVVGEFKLEWEDDPWDDVDESGRWLLDLERRERPHLVHLNGYSHGVLPFRAPKIVVGHSCVLSWWDCVKREPAPPEWGRYRDRVCKGLRGANLLVTPSAWMLGALDQHYGLNTSARLVYNGRRFTPAPENGVPRELVFAAGRLWDEAKNLRAVIESAPLLQWPVRIAGDGGTSSENVTHAGKLDTEAMREAYAAAGIYLFPALYEPFGLSILEAAISGCALVIGDIPSLREIWSDAAIYVPPRNPQAIASEVNALIADEALREKLSRRARVRAQRFTVQRMAAGYLSVYNEITGSVQPVARPALQSEARP